MSIDYDALSDYADLLLKNGYEVYEVEEEQRPFFYYSRTVGDRTYFGYVQRSDNIAGGYSHYMPIKQSPDYGAMMWIASVPEGIDNLTVTAAEAITQPTNRNSDIGEHENYLDLDDLYPGYVRRT